MYVCVYVCGETSKWIYQLLLLVLSVDDDGSGSDDGSDGDGAGSGRYIPVCA